MKGKEGTKTAKKVSDDFRDLLIKFNFFFKSRSLPLLTKFSGLKATTSFGFETHIHQST